MKPSKHRTSSSHAYVIMKEITKTDYQLRYHNSILGHLWSILKPMALFTILFFVFTKVFRVGDAIPHYSTYLLMGLVIWNFFLEATNTGLTSIIEKGDLIRKINFPKITIVGSKFMSALIGFGINSILIVIFMILFGSDVSIYALWTPLLLVELMIFVFGVMLLLSAYFVKVRDLSHLWEVGTQVLFYLTPIFYPIAFVISNFSIVAAKIMLLNPIAQITQDLRYILITPDTTTITNVYGSPYWRAIPIFISVATLVIGLLVFKSKSRNFAELS